MSRQDNITQEYLKSILDYNPDTGIFVWKYRPPEHFPAKKYSSKRISSMWNSKFFDTIAGSKITHRDATYINIYIDGVSYKAHRLAYLYIYGWLPDEVDHIDNNGYKTDNRICNLRAANEFQNQWNKGINKSNKSGHKGVSWSKQRNKWNANITCCGRRYNLGFFDNIEDAALAYSKASTKFHGKYGRTK